MIKSKFVNSLELIGGTPLVKLNNVTPEKGANIFAKLESFNPGGSVKDRIALAMVENAEKKGLLKPGSTIIEPTSGNTGIGLALVGAVKGYNVVLVMSENMSIERRRILESFGAKTELSRAEFGMEGTIEKAEELLAENPDFFMPQQFNNPANPEVHRNTTAPEIIEDMKGESVDAFVAGIGTGGTITGIAEKFKNFANRSLGINASNIKVLIDSKAKRLDAVEALKLWLRKFYTFCNSLIKLRPAYQTAPE